MHAYSSIFQNFRYQRSTSLITCSILFTQIIVNINYHHPINTGIYFYHNFESVYSYFIKQHTVGVIKYHKSDDTNSRSYPPLLLCAVKPTWKIHYILHLTFGSWLLPWYIIRSFITDVLCWAARWSHNLDSLQKTHQKATKKYSMLTCKWPLTPVQYMDTYDAGLHILDMISRFLTWTVPFLLDLCYYKFKKKLFKLYCKQENNGIPVLQTWTQIDYVNFL